MQIAIIYSSKTGNTEKVAKRIQGVLPESTVFDLENIPDLNQYHFIILGCWIDRGTADAKALEFFKTIENKDIAFFFTLGAYPDSKHAGECNNNIFEILESNNNNVYGSFWCHGKIDPSLTEWYKTLPLDHPHGLNPDRVKRLEIAAKHPDENDFKNAGKYFKDLISNTVIKA